MNLETLKGKILVPELVFDQFLELKGWSWHGLARGDLPLSFEDINFGLVCSDPEYWSRVFLKEPDTQAPYEYWPYQLESLKCKGDVIHSDGAEVGKTREIGNLLLWKSFTKEGASSLVGAPEQVHLDEIIDYMVEQMFDLSPELSKGLKRHKKHPHHQFIFNNRSRVYFSPAGFDGKGFRGKHVRDYCMMDEAAKIKNPDIYNEFWRSGKPGCVYRLYSVPDGDRTSVFHRLKERAKGNREKGDEKKEADTLESLFKGRKFVYFNWQKSQQPYPFWSPERRRHYIDLFGGEDSAGYKRNVLGEDGDPENPVFPWHHFSRILKDIPDYRVLKLLVDETAGTVNVFSAKYKVIHGKNERTGEEEILEDRSVPRPALDIAELLKGVFSPLQGLIYLGGDLGFSSDPTEIIVRLVLGKTWRTIARLQLKGVSYDLQADAINAMDDIFAPKGIGLDFGNAGSAVVHVLQSPDNYKGKHFDERVTGFQFGEAYDDLDENGEVIIDKKLDKPKRKLAKQLATDIMVKKMQRQELEYPFDPDYISEFPSHTYKTGARHIIYSKGKDHTIDAERVATLKMIIPDNVGADLFSSGVSIR